MKSGNTPKETVERMPFKGWQEFGEQGQAGIYL
jgi:hypothetical protein